MLPVQQRQIDSFLPQCGIGVAVVDTAYVGVAVSRLYGALQSAICLRPPLLSRGDGRMAMESLRDAS